MAELFRLTVDGGAQLCRATTLDKVADRIREQPDGRRHVRSTAATHVVATVDMQLGTMALFLHEAAVHDSDWPGWAHILRSSLNLHPSKPLRPTQENL